MECVKNTYCLNKSFDQKVLLKYITANIDNDSKNKLLYKDFGFNLDDKKNMKFKITPIVEKKYVILYILDKKSKKDALKYCLKLTLKNMYKKDKYYYFKKSKIDSINRGVCALNKKNVITETMDGTYLVKLVDKINKIFKVETSSLDDDATLEICDVKNVKIKIIKLLTEGKTWYEKTGGFRLEDEKIYKDNEIVRNLKYSYLYDIFKTYKFDFFSYRDDQPINEKKLDKTLEILKKYNLSKDNTIKEITTKFFDSKSKNIEACDKAHIYEYVIDLPKRATAYHKKDDKDLDNYRTYYNFISGLKSFNNSIKKYNNF